MNTRRIKMFTILLLGIGIGSCLPQVRGAPPLKGQAPYDKSAKPMSSIPSGEVEQFVNETRSTWGGNSSTATQDALFRQKADEYVSEDYSKFEHNCYQLGVESCGSAGIPIKDDWYPNRAFNENNQGYWQEVEK